MPDFAVRVDGIDREVVGHKSIRVRSLVDSVTYLKLTIPLDIGVVVLVARAVAALLKRGVKIYGVAGLSVGFVNAVTVRFHPRLARSAST